MGKFRPIDTKCWEKFLAFNGFQQNRSKGSHFCWTKKGKRPIPVWHNEKQIPAFHLSTGCRTIGCTMEYLYTWVEENC